MSIRGIMTTRQRSIRHSLYPERDRQRFGEVTHGNHIVFSIDGQETFKLIYDEINRAQNFIYIAGYDLDPSLSFIREEGQNLGNGPIGISTKGSDPRLGSSKSFKSNRSSTVASEVSQGHQNHGVRSSISESPEEDQSFSTSSSNLSAPAQNHSTGKAHSPLQKLIIGKARQGVEVRIIVWQPKLPLRILPGAGERGLDGRSDEVKILSKLARGYKIEQNLVVKIDNTSPTLSSAHHEKIIVIDNAAGFCGGFDLSSGKWDTSMHEYNSPFRDKESEPWHDVHCMVKGPVVWDLTLHFNERWAYDEIKDENEVRALNLKPPPVPNRYNIGNTRTVALRTWEGMDRDGGILAWYSNIIRKAKNSIYIENQFPFQNEFITRILCKRLQDQENLQVIIVGPMEPNLPGLVGSILSRTSINDVNKHLQWLRDAGDDGRRVRTYSLVSQDQKSKKLRQIYVHSKVMIVDDKWITIGSANTDKNGFKDSTEVNLGITSRRLAKELRIRLWYEHLGWVQKDEISTMQSTKVQLEKAGSSSSIQKVFSPDYTEVVDFESGFDLLKKIADYNGSSVANNSYIIGHLYYYNFEDMRLPPPYPEAKGGDKFEFL
jgi:phosphatidylserine/phosphatidylglycerophosphate/cardiolipin synthase-like enzyme